MYFKSGKHVREVYTPLYPTLIYKKKLGFIGVCHFFLVLIQNIDCVYSLAPPRQGGPNVSQQSMN